MDNLNSLLLVQHPIESIQSFWDHAKSLRRKAPADAFSDLLSLKLVGPFDYIDVTKIDEAEKREALTKHRFPTDLPEMQTLMVYEGGRFCYWRDSPKDSDPFLVHVSHSSDHFPKMDVIGNTNLFCALHCLLKVMSLPQEKAAKYEKFFLNGYNPIFYDTLVKEVKKKRSKLSVGSAFHGLGIVLTVKDDVGYRTVTDNPKRLKHDIETMGTIDNENLRKNLRQNFLELYSYVQIANDEKDFGMGLEFGHDLFISNYACFDSLAKSVLKQAYQLLERNEFVEILEAHYKMRRIDDESSK